MFNLLTKSFLLLATSLVNLVLSPAFSQATSPTVVSSIYPLQQIANAITGKETELVANTFLSPHNYRIKPSDSKKIKEADLFIWISETMMPQLTPYIKQRTKANISIANINNIQLIFSSQHDHEHIHEHNDNSEDKHKNEIEKQKDSKNSKFNYDPHLWLSTNNAKIIAENISKHLSDISPNNAKKYNNNLEKFIRDIDTTKHQIKTLIAPIKNKPYFVFHEAYKYFEQEFGIKNKGAIKIDTNKNLTSKSIYTLQKTIKNSPNSCLFKEPQFNSKIINQLAPTHQIATVDPVGYTKDKSKNYQDILLNIAKNISNCLQGESESNNKFNKG